VRSQTDLASELDRWRCTLDDFRSADESMVRCLELARTAARIELPILILGETGTGKTLLGRAIHNSSSRAGSPFVSFNAAALSDTLADSQLFGHERGAFTGADRAVKGKFELAHKGTLFLDELADMTPTVQAKILRAVEYGEFERLGSEQLRVADVRLISATYLPIDTVGADRVRRDLFYRLGGFLIHLPPLRDRPQDLRALVASEILLAGRKQHKELTGLDRSAADLLFSHSWPGNLRELNQVIQAAVALTPAKTIPAEAILIGSGASHRPEMPGQQESRTAAQDDLTLAAVEQQHIHAVLERLRGNKRQAARVLGISRSRLDRKLAGIG
jgi:transcriptional regulator with PAS, ATPase and Fis domain